MFLFSVIAIALLFGKKVIPHSSMCDALQAYARIHAWQTVTLVGGQIQVHQGRRSTERVTPRHQSPVVGWSSVHLHAFWRHLLCGLRRNA